MRAFRQFSEKKVVDLPLPPYSPDSEPVRPFFFWLLKTEINGWEQTKVPFVLQFSVFTENTP